MENRIHKILIAPLDWGLGHATRCMPLISMFLLQGKEVLIATSGPALTLLKQEYPSLQFFELTAYNIHYKHESMSLNMLSQLPKIRASILKENREVQKIIHENEIDLIISDNRYGVHNPDIPSVFMGHQLAIQMPKRAQVLSSLTLKGHAKMLEPFNQIWVPDFPNQPNLSGRLSHNVAINNEVFFIGPLSRFSLGNRSVETEQLLFILSGQEPQRTKFEDVILKQIHELKQSVVLLRGLPDNSTELKIENPNVKIYNHLSARELERYVAASQLIICRSGYSSIMDLAAMNKKALFIPTPGQTEQEYLANYLMKTGAAYSVKQSELNLKEDIKRSMKYKALNLANTNLEENVQTALNKL